MSKRKYEAEFSSEQVTQALAEYAVSHDIDNDDSEPN